LRKKNIFTALLAAGSMALTGTAMTAEEQVQGLPFMDPDLQVEQRVDDLVARLTLQEKIAQMFTDAPAIERLGIPKYQWWNEALHGVARAGSATVFPQAIGMAATFDEDLMLRVATAISDEGRAKHHHFYSQGVNSIYTGLTFWSPNINIFRDPRWGRGQETYGEDPYLTSRMATQFVNGLQGDNGKYLKTVATLKHYAVHSGPEISRHRDDYRPTPRDMTETYLAAFRDTLAQTPAASVMCAYNRVNGEPACGSDELMKEWLRGRFGFEGYVVSDCGAIADFYDPESHHVVETPAQAAAKAVRSGTDLNCGDSHGNTISHLNEAIQLGLITEAEIDQAVGRLFKARFQLGIFDPESRVDYRRIPYSVVGSDKHLALTREAAEKSLVLLKNNGILPLKKGIKVAVVGPNAANLDVLLGNYHGKPVRPVLPLAGLQKYPGASSVLHATGSSLAKGVYAHYETIDAGNFWHAGEDGSLQPGLQAEYYADPEGSGQPALVRVDSKIDFEWELSPVDGSMEDEFLVRWIGILRPQQSGRFVFSTTDLSFLLDGKEPDGPVELEKDKPYRIEATAGIVGNWHHNTVQPATRLSWVNVDRDLAAEALQVAKAADVVLFLGGISPRLEGEEMPLELDGFSHGDRTHINLPESQEKLLKALHATGKPVVMVNFSGSAVALNWQHENLAAIVQAFYPGEAAGAALAGLLWGDYSPSGRLPVTFYSGVEDLPAFTDYSMANRTYKYYQGEPLYPFAYGLSYTTFEYSGLQPVGQVKAGNDAEWVATVTNTGTMEAEEVVQLYLSMPDAPAGTPQKSLVGFSRIRLQPGESGQVRFSVTGQQLSYVDEQGRFQAYEGRLKVEVTGGVRDAREEIEITL
jgi:beta-glucosidase